ncbi:hypothetical protein PRIPAC_97890 [Pristionchus pacificus]|uniref:G protein-coupled receptor n=1 Tax=Pristionchus pacificus TaxID=54126 RepID=A0A2A6BJ64_PRIPA|nr:hypothetical protein PRIPAC_97890 [Pristionchus pacificus]|eukprot:PDM65841.1 G protein-coupled receptor [Pristionchus pacificus]
MDSEELRMATVIVHTASIFGFTTNVIAILTIVMSIKLRTSSMILKFRFGILCACLAANNTFVLVLNSTWYLMPADGIFVLGSSLSRAVGVIGLALFVMGIRFHILISFNRLIVLAFPLTLRYRNEQDGSSHFGSRLVISTMFPTCFKYAIPTSVCTHAVQLTICANEIGKFYELLVRNLILLFVCCSYFNYLPISVEFGIVMQTSEYDGVLV